MLVMNAALASEPEKETVSPGSLERAAQEQRAVPHSRFFEGRRVLVTGASSGIGLELARRFARDGARLALVARRADKLAELAEELRTTGGAEQVVAIRADLAEEGAGQRVWSEAAAALGSVEVLINNAGVGEYGPTAEKNLADLERMMHLNMDALVRLTHLALQPMLARRSGWIMNIASLAAFQPTPYMGAYGATKAFVLQFSLSLWEEVRRQGVVVTCVCPGPVRTGFFSRGGYEARMKDFTRLSTTADWVAEKAYRALVRKKPVCMPGGFNRLLVFTQRFVPLKVIAKLAGKVLGPRA